MVEKTTKKQPGGITGKGFVKGVSGNPNGRPPGSVSIVEGIKRKLLEIEPGNKKTYLDLFLNKLFLKAIKEGDTSLIRDMINRVDGMPLQKINAEVNQVNVKIEDVGNKSKNNTPTEAD